MLEVFLVFHLTRVFGALYCANDPCTTCNLQMYVFNTLSCLKLCPTGYTLNAQVCNKGTELDLIILDLLKPVQFNITSVQGFSNPSGLEFNNPLKLTPSTTKERGLYFWPNTHLINTQQLILSPIFTLSAYFKYTASGVLFEINSSSGPVISVRLEALEVIFSISLASFNSSLIKTWKTSYNSSNWYSYRILFVTNKNSISINNAWITSEVFNVEFRMDDYPIGYSLGKSNSASFTGFLVYFCLSNTDTCTYKRFDDISICGPNQYQELKNCSNCVNGCYAWPFCTRNTCKYCFSSDCESCSGFGPLDCTLCGNTSLDSCMKGKNCLSGSGFNCDSCLAGFIIKSGLCVKNYSLPDYVELNFKSFNVMTGNVFQSGFNKSTFSPFNNPEKDDPIACAFRGYYFVDTYYMKSNQIIMNYEFSIFIWRFYITTATIFRGNKFRLNEEGTFSISLSNYESTQSFIVPGKCTSKYWNLLGVIIKFMNKSTLISLICGTSISITQTFEGYAFYDISSEIMIRNVPKANLFLYKIMIYQQAINFVFSDFNHICPPKSANECLSNLANKVYKNTFIGRELPCESICESCTRWGTCNSCEDILCETCESFDEICTPDSNFNPCLPGFVLSNDKKFCCHSQCTGCIGPFVYLCTSCADGFKLNINLCTLQCPTGYSFNQTHCFVPSGSKVLSTRLDVIANVFNDLFQNTFYVGNERKFYPERDENDPIPAKSRGFYFLGKSVLRTSEFKIPHWASLEFWVRQDARGILIRKGEIVIDSNVSHNYSGNYVNTGISLKNETWMSLIISTFVYLDMYIIKTKLNGATEHVYSSTNFIDDKNSPIFLGDPFNGFKGFISLFLISGNIELPVSSISVCASIDNSACLWNCSINSFWTTSGCVPCKPNCNEGCVSSKNCNKCAMNLCYNCSNFVSGCISCLQNAEQVLNCSCKPGYFETTDSDQCLSCSFGCSKCKLTTSCIECFSGFTLSNGNCLCSEGFYTTSAGCLPCHSFCKSCFGGLSNECTTCKTSFMLMNNNECKCEQNSAYNTNTNLCESCQEKCEICSIPSFCTQCKSGYQLDINGHCSCQLGTYLENNECKPCNSLCKSCWGPNEAQCESCTIGYFRISQKCECKKPQSYSLCLKCDTSLNLKQQDNLCLCQEGFYPKYTCKDCIGPCECENQISWIDECLKCDTSCLTCSDFNYFHCESCEKFFLDHLCFDVCPLGYKIDGTQCKVNETVALFLLFDLNLPSSNSVFFCSDQKNLPFPIMNRGIFFPESSNCLKYKITERPALAPSFFISTWFKVSGNFQVFQVKCSELFIISFKYLKKLVFTFKVNGRQNDIQSELQVKEELWNYFLISVKFQQFSEVSMKINRDYEEVLPGFEGAFKDPGFGFISFGENFEGLLGSGLIYLFRILTKSARIEDFYLLDLPECKNLSIAENFCISECGPFEVNLNFTCKPCKAECLFGCINLTSCWQCDDPSCMTCNPLIPRKCFKCKKKFEMQGKSCVRCKISEFYDEVSLKCLPCPELCFNCESKTFCTSCIENSQIQSNKSCSCKSGYKKSSNSCIQVTFKVVSTVSKSNEITLYFTESLNNSINSESILVTLGDSKVDFTLKEKDKKTYILLLQIPRSSKSFPKNLKITFFQTIYSINSSLLETSVIELNLYDVEEIKNHETSEENKGQISALTAASLAFLACVFLMNPQSFFNFLNLIEMYSYVLLYDIEIHQDFIDFLNGLKSSTKFPSVNLMKIKGERNVSRKFEIYGITSSYILDNFGVQIFLLLGMIVLVLSSLIISLSKIRFIKNLSSKILNSLCFNWFIQFFNVQCFDLAVFCLLSLFNFHQDVWLEIFDYSISAVLMAGLASLLVLQLLIIVKYSLNNPDFQVNTKFSVLFERFQITNWSKFLFNTIFLSRRLFTAFLIHFSYGIFQLLSSIIFTFMNLFYVSFNNPFKELKDCLFQIFNEGILLSFFAVLLINRLEIYQFSSFVEAEICIRIVLAALGFNVFFNFYEIVQKVVLWVKSRIGSGKVTHLGNEETGNTFAGIKAAKNRCVLNKGDF